MAAVAHYPSSQSVTLDDEDDKLQLAVRRMDSLRVDFQVDAHRDSRVGATVIAISRWACPVRLWL